MKAIRTIKIDRWAGLATALLALTATGCGSTEATENDAAAAEEDAYIKVVNVEVRPLAAGAFTSYVRLTGAVEALEDVVVSSQEAGVIERVIVDRGSRVRAGQPIAAINDEILAAQVDESRASASLASERYERQRQLWEDEGIGSEIAFLQTKYDAQSADARLAFLEVRLARHTIRSPIAGVLDERYVDLGEIVAPGTPVARVLAIDRLKVVGGVPERFGPYVNEGGRAVLHFDVLPGQVIEGTIAYVGAAVDKGNRTFPIEVLLDNPEGRLKPQMMANIRVATERLTDVIVVPQDVVLRTEDGYQVFVVVENPEGPVAEARSVDLGPSFENEVVVVAGLETGDRLIVKGHQMVDAGDRVREVGEGGGR
jgi:membrane fusion protein (multidrug efflux system)